MIDDIDGIDDAAISAMTDAELDELECKVHDIMGRMKSGLDEVETLIGACDILIARRAAIVERIRQRNPSSANLWSEEAIVGFVRIIAAAGADVLREAGFSVDEQNAIERRIRMH